jgi:acyl transferase domain-containing protein/surfactin synthase thioesterase subunit
MTAEPARGIAIIGMACRFPGAETTAEFWQNLRHGIESVTFFADDELIAAGVEPSLLQIPEYVKASPILKNVETFDAAFFGYSPKEAAIMDPQHRIFLETCWEAFEDAGYDPATHDTVVGVFAGAGSALSSYLLAHHDHPDMQGQTASLQHINNDNDFLATRVSYKLNLTGPSLTVQTACSTSLVAVHLACQSLLSGECDVALAGASTVRIPHLRGYLAERGSVHSQDGHCKAFDAAGVGTIFGSGVAAVLLKPVAAALEDGDHIYAVIRGSAVTNDGAGKVSYTAASAIGQARAVIEALESAQVTADTIGYVECHATGTPAGDPVEIQALTRAFRLHTNRKGFCAVGSVKTNIGHPEQSAGFAGLIKTALALYHGEIPPTVHFTTPNPGIPFADSPFYVQATLGDWRRGDTRRRGAVNSLGIGGTNAFLVLEEAPETARHPRVGDSGELPGRGVHEQLFCVSARTPQALRSQAQRFLCYLDTCDGTSLDDICHTVNPSRTAHPFRFAATCSTTEDLKASLRSLASRADEDISAASDPRALAFLVAGQGTQYPGMSADLYRTMPRYRDVMDQCDAALRPYLKTSLIELLFAREDPGELLNQTRFTQPALFALEYALAELWRSFGLVPRAIMGHSIGELVAACVAGVLEFRDAIEFVAVRGQLMQGLPTRGAMAAVFADEAIVSRALRAVDGHVSIAAVNSPRNTVISGERDSVGLVRERLAGQGIGSRLLDVSEAFHSALVEPVLPALEKAAMPMTSRTPKITFISNITGRPHETAPSAGYWREHARHSVRFYDGMLALRELGCGIFLEIGPGSTTLALGRECVPDASGTWLASLNRHKGDARTILESLGRLYLEGYRVVWDGLAGGSPRRRVPLPTYPFERKRFWLACGARTPSARTDERVPATPLAHAMLTDDATVLESVEDCLYHVRWQEQEAPVRDPRSAEPVAWLIFSDSEGVGAALVNALRRRGQVCHVVLPRLTSASPGPGVWTVDPAQREEFDRLLQAVRRSEPRRIHAIVLLWSLDAPSMRDMTSDDLQDVEAISARSMLHLTQALAAANGYDQCRLWAATRGAQRLCHNGDESCEPAQALLWGMGRTIALEAPALWGGTIDLAIDSESREGDAESLAEAILDSRGERQIAVRGGRRYVPRIERLPRDPIAKPSIPVSGDATYLITGGSGMLGLTIARWLVDRGARHLALLARSNPTGSAQKELVALEAQGARVRVFRGDVASEADLRRVLADMRGDLPPVRGIVHGAGVLADRILVQMSWDRFTRATAPKVRGTWLLHQCLRDVDLDFFLVQSSLLSLTGSAAQANYTAANAFLDAFVDYRRSHGMPATAINWGPWAGAGMALSAGSRSEALWRARGVSFIRPAFARRALDRVFAQSVDHVTVAICDWELYATQVGRSAPLYATLAKAARSGVCVPDAVHAGALGTGPAGADVRRDRTVLLEALREQVTSELGLEVNVDTRQPLQQLGVDSLMSVNLANRLEAALGVSVPVATLVRGPSLEQLADELLAGAGARSAAPSNPDPPESIRRAPHSESRGRGWLVFPKPNDAALARLFCFNYAGGGAAPFRAWTSLIAPGIELVIVEPPGRGSRIDESPIVRLDVLLGGLLPEMRPYLDRPCAFFGHCLGALTLFEVARRLLRDGFPDLRHLFVSGARPPNRISTTGPFEEALLMRLLADPRYDPLRPLHEQPDDTFADALRQFNIWATDDFLAHRELRTLLLPAIRADFEIAAAYKFTTEPPWDVPITCFNGLDDHYVTRDQAVEWNRHTRREFAIHLREGNHFLVVEDRDFIVATINTTLAAAAKPLGGLS